MFVKKVRERSNTEIHPNKTKQIYQTFLFLFDSHMSITLVITCVCETLRDGRFFRKREQKEQVTYQQLSLAFFVIH